MALTILLVLALEQSRVVSVAFKDGKKCVCVLHMHIYFFLSQRREMNETASRSPSKSVIIKLNNSEI